MPSISGQIASPDIGNFEDMEIHDNLRKALSDYKFQLATNQVNNLMGSLQVNYDTMENLSHLIWNHCNSMR